MTPSSNAQQLEKEKLCLKRVLKYLRNSEDAIKILLFHKLAETQ